MLTIWEGCGDYFMHVRAFGMRWLHDELEQWHRPQPHPFEEDEEEEEDDEEEEEDDEEEENDDDEEEEEGGYCSSQRAARTQVDDHVELGIGLKRMAQLREPLILQRALYSAPAGAGDVRACLRVSAAARLRMPCNVVARLAVRLATFAGVFKKKTLGWAESIFNRAHGRNPLSQVHHPAA
jgi:hypothetical protein